MIRNALAVSLALFCITTAATSAYGADKLRLERTDLSKSPTLRVYVTMTDAEGHVVGSRAKEEVKLVLDSAEQGPALQLQTFDTTNEPINLVALVQVSQAMQEVADDVKKGVKVLANALPPKSKMALIGYSSDSKRLAELGPPVDAETAANQLTTDTEFVEVHLLEAMRTAIDILNATPSDQRKVIVLFSDGIDVNMEAAKSFLSIGKRAGDAGIVVDTIGYGPFEPARLRDLTQFTKQSNGGERVCKNTTDVMGAFNDVADELRKQYVATYELVIPGGDGKMHTFQISTEASGHIAYSNVINKAVPPHVHKPNVKAAGHRWWLWAVCILGGVIFVMLIVWLIFREKDEAPMAFAQPQPEPQGKPRTMALDIGAGGGTGGRVSAVGWLVATSGRQADKTFPLKNGKTVIGTAHECDVVIEDGFASSRHAEVRLSGNTFRIVDLGSTNGLTVNDKKIREHELVDNDRITIGRTELKFKSVVQ